MSLVMDFTYNHIDPLVVLHSYNTTSISWNHGIHVIAIYKIIINKVKPVL